MYTRVRKRGRSSSSQHIPHPFATAKGGKQELKCTAPPLAPVNTNHSRAQCLGTHTYTNKAGATPSNISHTFAIAKGGKQELRCTPPPLTPKAHNRTCARHLESRHSVSPQVLSLNHTPLRCESQPAITAHGGKQELRYTAPPLKLNAQGTTCASHLLRVEMSYISSSTKPKLYTA